MRYLSHARPIVRDLSSVCPTGRLPTLSHLPHQRSTPRSASTTPHSPTTSTAATRSSAWSSSPSSSSSVATPARAPSRRPSESSRACTRNQPCHVVEHGCPAALRQASCRHGSGARGAETFKQRASCDSRGHRFPFLWMRPALFPLCKLALAPQPRASADACASDCLRLR